MSFTLYDAAVKEGQRALVSLNGILKTAEAASNSASFPAARIHPGGASIAFTHATADGLEVTLATEAAADAVVIENGFGEVVLRKGGEVVAVAGPDQPGSPAAVSPLHPRTTRG